jgi:signal transduction histidine kinase
LKRHLTAFSIAASFLLLAIMMFVPREGQGAATTPSDKAASVVDFQTYDGVLGQEKAPPITGWTSKTNALELVPVTNANRALGNKYLWGRMRFDRDQVGSAPLAIYMVGTRDQFKVLFNGRELLRNFGTPTNQAQAWYRPFLIPIPDDSLQAGTNEILVQTTGWKNLAIGRTIVGPQIVLTPKFDLQILLRINGPIIANTIMALLGLCAVFLWSVRRTETELLFLALTAAFWLVRNYHFYTDKLIGSPVQFQAITHVSLYFAAAASASFGFAYLKTPHYQKIILCMFAYGIVVSLLHLVSPLSPIVIMLSTFAIALLTSIVGAVGLFRTRSIDHLMVSLVMASIIISASHDFGRNEDFWDGAGFYFQPYVGFFFTAVFLLSFGRRAQNAFVVLETTNEILESRVEDVRLELARSEQGRRALEVNQAVAEERVRLMREMHDGIGSNLLTALAIAEHQSQPETTIRAFKRALSDLKITVDSLEPIDGDIVVLIGNLRHRMTNDLRDAGLKCVWEMKECRPIKWLDATSALHAVRIVQEAISNVIEHAGSDLIRIGCYEEVRDGANGVTIFVADTGKGFKLGREIGGKGMDNMKSRASSIHAIFACESRAKVGTTITLWLPELNALIPERDQNRHFSG